MAKKTKFNILKPKPNCIVSVRRIFVISKVFGCNLFHLPKNRHSTEPIKMRAVDCAIVPLYVVLYLVFTFPLIIETIATRTSLIQSSGSFVIINVGKIIFYAIILANFTCYVMDVVNKSKIWKLLTNLYDFDDDARLLGVLVINNNRYFLAYIVRLTMMIITMTGACTYLLNKYYEYYWLIIRFFISYVMMDGCYSSTFILYNYFIFDIAKRFKAINVAICDLLNIQDIRRNRSTTESCARDAKSDQLQVLVGLAKLYQKLNDSIRILNECYSLQISLIIAVIFQFTLICFFMIYRNFVGRNDWYTVKVTLAYFVRTLYFYSQIVLAIVHGTRLSEEAKYTKYILNKGLNLPLKESVLNQIEQFLLQINHSFTTVSCGLFSMDWTLFYTMAAAVVSYLVLFIQFDTLVIPINL